MASALKSRAPTGHPCGESHYRARLTDAQVTAIRGQYQEWQDMGMRKGYDCLAMIYGVGMSTIRDIVKYRTRINA